MPKEPTHEWCKVPGFDLYLCSKEGKIKNRITNRILKPAIDKNGYERVVLVEKHKKHNIAVHRVVGITFLENKYNKPQINHKDGNKQNNNVGNLEWVTNQENIHHAISNGLIKVYGEQNPNCKITKRMAEHIRTIWNTGKWNKSQIANMFNISRTLVRYIVEDKIWR